MKRIEAIVRQERLEAVKEALRGSPGVTVAEVKGHGAQGGVIQPWRGRELVVDLLPKVSVMVVVHDHEVAGTIDAIVRAAGSGVIGDGKVFVSPIEQVIRIRTGESGPDAL